MLIGEPWERNGYAHKTIGTRKKMLDFFKDPLMRCPDDRLYIHSYVTTFMNAADIFMTLDNISGNTRERYPKAEIRFSFQNKGMLYVNRTKGESCFRTEDMPVPEEAQKVMEVYAENCILTVRERDYNDEDFYCSIMHKWKDRVICRSFAVIIYYGWPDSRTKVEFMEFRRTVYEESTSVRKDVDLTMPETVMVWCGDMTGTIFEDSRKYIDDAVSYFHINAGYQKLHDIIYGYNKSRRMGIKKAETVAAMLGSFPVLQKMLDVRYDDVTSESLRDWRDSILYAVIKSETERGKTPLDLMFDYNDKSAKDIDDALCLPEGTIEAALKEAVTIEYLKDLQRDIFFQSEETKDYFLHKTDRYDIKHLIGMIGAWKRDGKYELKAETLGILIRMYGPQRWKDFMEHINSMWYDDIKYYRDYVKILEKDSNYRSISDTCWMTTGEEIRKIGLSSDCL